MVYHKIIGIKERMFSCWAPRALIATLGHPLQNNPLKKKKKVSLSNIDSQNHKHKLRFERGHKPKNKKTKENPNFFFWRTQSTKALSPISDSYSTSLYLRPPRSPMIEGGFVGVVEIFVVRVEIVVELELRLKMIVDDRLS